MSDDFIGVMGMLIILLIGFTMGIFTVMITNHWVNASDAITECEQDLPRNQKCKIIGVIDNENNN